MTKSLSNIITLILACIGSVLALLLTLEYYFADKITLPCSAHGAGCQGTLSSDYAHLGPIPTAAFGMGMYLLLAALCIRRRKLLLAERTAEEARARAYAAAEAASSEAAVGVGEETAGAVRAGEGDTSAGAPLRQRIRQADMAVWVLALLGFGISWWLQYTSIWVIHSFCPYCFTSALLVTAIFALASRDHLLDGRELTGEQKLLAVVVGFVLVLMGFIIVPEVQSILRVGPSVQTVMLTLRSVLVRPDPHIKGDPNAKYTLVEFADYMCPHCAETNKVLPDLLQNHPEIKLVYRNFPLGFPHTKFAHSDEASYAAEAAALQGKFWEMHDYLFEHQKETSAPTFATSNFDNIASDIGLNLNKFDKDFQSDAIHQRVSQDSLDGMRASVDVTPTFYLITPDKITKISGRDDLVRILATPRDPAWK